MKNELQRIKNLTGGNSDISSAARGRLTLSLATAIRIPEGPARRQGSLPPLTTPYFLSASPVPHLRGRPSGDYKSEEVRGHLKNASTLSSVPRQVVDVMLKHYCEIYRPQYPAIEESDLHRACDKVYNNAQPSDLDVFIVHITLAISVGNQFPWNCTFC